MSPAAGHRTICMINAHYLLGGAETVMHQITEGLRKEGFAYEYALPTLGKTLRKPSHVRLLYPRLLNRLRYTRWNSRVEKVWPSDLVQNRNLQRLAKLPRRLFHVHSFTGYADVRTLAALAAQRPLLWTLHCYWGGESLPAGQSTPYPAAWGLAPQVQRPSRTQDDLRSLHEELQPLYAVPLWITTPSAKAARAARLCPELANWQIHHLPNGVDTAAFSADRKQDRDLRHALGLAPEKAVILLVNRDFKIADKGWPMAQEALRALPAAANVQVLLVGQNADWAAQQLPEHLNPVVRDFVADRPEMIRLYETSDIFLFASRRENFPCVILEAMAAGCCVVATPTDGVTEQIHHEQEGLLAADIAGPALISPLKLAVEDASLRQQLGRKARTRVEEEFSEALMVRRYLALYQQMEETAQ